MAMPEHESTAAIDAAMMDEAAAVVRVVRGFATADEVDSQVGCIQRKPGLFRVVEGSFGIAPRYRVIPGHAVRDELPEVVAFGEQRIRPLAEAFAGRPLAPIGDSPHDIRIQHFAEPSHNFRWHYDGHTYNALLTLVNTNRSETQVIAPALSRVLRRVYLPLALTPRLFSLLPHRSFATSAGDVLLLRGEGLLHRGVSRDTHGERLLVVFCFNEVGKAPRRLSWLRRRMLRAINFGYAYPTRE
jgi:hypothetical protein